MSDWVVFPSDNLSNEDSSDTADETVLMSRIGRRNALAHIMDEENTGDAQDDDDDETDYDDDQDDAGIEEQEDVILLEPNGSRQSQDVVPVNVTPFGNEGEEEEDDLLSLATSGSRRSPSEEILSVTEVNLDLEQRQEGGVYSSPPAQPTVSGKHRLSSPRPSPLSKKARDSPGSQDDSTDYCPICFEPWSNSGAHKLISLKCGHLFGQNCIERWIKTAKKCPQCNAKARKADVRVLFAKRLKAIDTVALTEAVNLYESERELRRKKEMELAKALMQYQMAMTEVNRLKSEVEDLKRNQVMPSLPNPVHDSIPSSSQGENRFSHFKNFFVSNGNCRVMDYQSSSMCLAISHPSPHANFMSGFGLKKFSLESMKSLQFNIMHSKAIRDVKFSPHSNLVLTASQDETLKLTNWDNSSHVHTYNPQRPVWSCCFDSTDTFKLYAGLNNGLIHCYDIRFTEGVTETISNPTSRCPIVTMYHLPPTDNPYSPGGLLVQTLEGVMLWQKRDGAEYAPYMLPLPPGRCVALQYCDKLKQCLVSYRPGQCYPTTTHILCQLSFGSVETSEVNTDVIERFQGGQTHKMLTRNALFSIPAMGSLACVGDEANKRVNIYEAKPKGRLLQSLSCNGVALDILPVSINETNYLTMLTDTNLNLYKQK